LSAICCLIGTPLLDDASVVRVRGFPTRGDIRGTKITITGEGFDPRRRHAMRVTIGGQSADIISALQTSPHP